MQAVFYTQLKFSEKIIEYQRYGSKQPVCPTCRSTEQSDTLCEKTDLERETEYICEFTKSYEVCHPDNLGLFWHIRIIQDKQFKGSSKSTYCIEKMRIFDVFDPLSKSPN